MCLCIAWIILAWALGWPIRDSTPLSAGVKVERSSAVKDQLILSGNDVELVSRSAALINQVQLESFSCGGCCTRCL